MRYWIGAAAKDCSQTEQEVPASLAEELEVTVRSVYRDVATLQARRIPIEGAAGVEYVLRRGYELPPLRFTEDEAIAVGVRLPAAPVTSDSGH